MHEEALLRDLRRKLEEIALQEQVDRIARVTLWVGALAHVSEATLRDRWPEVVEGTAAENAGLEVETSTDLADPRAGGIVLARVDVSGGGGRPARVGSAPGEFMSGPGHSDDEPESR
jgi:hydrogenase nickel incorporation protein HypA/HybF